MKTEEKRFGARGSPNDSDPDIVVQLLAGNLHEITGEDGKDVPEFVATRYEVRQLCKYWSFQRIEHDFFSFLYPSIPASQPWSAYIDQMLNRLGAVLGDGVMRGIYDDALYVFRDRYSVTEEVWRVFREGTKEEQDTWREKYLRELDSDEETQIQ